MIVARKLTSADEDFWTIEDGKPQMPPALVLESICQAGSWLIYLSSGGERTGALLSVAEVDIGGPVRPGDTLLLEGTVDSIDDERAIMSGTVSVDGTVVLTAKEITCALIAVEALDDPVALRRRADLAMRGSTLP